MKGQIARRGMILLWVMLPALIVWLLRPVEVAVDGAEYSAGPVMIRVYEDEAAPESYWVLMGARSDDARLTLLDDNNGAIVSTTGYADARQEGAVRVRIDRLCFGVLWLPERVLTFQLPAGDLPLRTPENAARLTAAFWTALHPGGMPSDQVE